MIKKFKQNVTSLHKIGELIDINKDEVKTLLNKKRKTMVIAILLSILASIFLSGCIQTFYTSPALIDFSWIWRLF